MLQPEQVAEDPRRFYKYTTNATAQLVLEHRSLRWSSPFAYNDPSITSSICSSTSTLSKSPA